jgi:hypothetical protein
MGVHVSFTIEQLEKTVPVVLKYYNNPEKKGINYTERIGSEVTQQNIDYYKKMSRSFHHVELWNGDTKILPKD